jgi:hypothetical protein
MRSFRVGRIASLLSILLLSLANTGCPELNRQPDYMGNQSVSVEKPLPAIASAKPSNPATQMFDHGSIVLSN